ncbi:MAG: hypothetical protein OXI83_16310 [Gemmatimonadota bacterium]|nr:hypothetical protein [Gemmatimonadota bacterium]
MDEAVLVRQLTEACEEQLELLRGTLRVHETLFGPLGVEQGNESETLLRLRKVYCHAGLVASWAVDWLAIHAMAPDIRAALVQLKTLTRDGVCGELHEPGDRDCTVQRCFSGWDGLLAPFSHPTTVVLVSSSDSGGFRRDDVRCLRALYVLLHGLSSCYASVLEVEALRRGLPLEDGFANSAWRDPSEVLDVAGRYLANVNRA